MNTFAVVIAYALATAERGGDDGRFVARQDDQKPRVKIVSITPQKAEAKNGKVIRVAFALEIEKGWHIYPVHKKRGVGKPAQFTFEPTVEVRAAIEEPPPLAHNDPDPELVYDYHEGTISITVPLALKDTKPGPVEVKGRLTYQICTETQCVDNATPITFMLMSLGGKDAETPSTGAPKPEPVKQDAKDTAQKAAQQEYEKRGLLGFLGLAILGGAISLLMPCVYPLIPITLTYFIKQGAGSRTKGMALSSVYSLGIIVTFTGLGFLFTLLLGEDGPRKFAANPWVNSIVALLFFWFAFALFGLYEISLPSFITGSMTGGGQKKGFGGAFILGLLFSVVTFTCTIPIAATILAVSASAGAGFRFIGLVAMLVYSATMAAPFFVLGMFPSLLKEVPKSGGWLHTVKVTAGFAELALALMYFAKADLVWNLGVLTRPVMIGVWVVVLAFTALYLLRVFRLRDPHEPPPDPSMPTPSEPPIGITRMLVALVFAVCAVIMGSGFTGRSLSALDIVLPPNVEGGVTGSLGVAQQKFEMLTVALEESKRTGKPLFVDFTGVT